ncbi:unnamed protein product [Ambrosiozyma monospora]|uniref:Unnamed protein product n=1 Tax=Ambrosiozyma monospora TaxID=43982 RepID=A0ACB5TRP4_AMBMO|nr:unnamed protein product [Ambrosiozyma monospora]
MTADEPTIPKPPKRITNDDLYRRSTQYRFWSFTTTELQDLRTASNRKGIQKVKDKISALDQTLPEAQVLNPENFPMVSQEEELSLVTFFARKCVDLANYFRLPAQVKATAVSYLYKFFLHHSVMEFQPQYIMYTCLFLAAKTENHFIGIRKFVENIPKTTPEQVLQNEYLLLETMKFSLAVHHPYQPLYGFYLDVQVLLPKLGKSQTWGYVYDNARQLVHESLFTDLKFCYTPPQIALACLWLSKENTKDENDHKGELILKRYLAKKFGVKKKKGPPNAASSGTGAMETISRRRM